MTSQQQKPFSMNESLFKEAPIRAAVEGNGRAAPSCLTLVGFAFLTFNSAMAVYQSNGGMGAAAFVAFSLLDLVLLFYCLRLYNQAAPRSLRREHLKMAMWLLATTLNYSAFMLLEFWILSTGASCAKSGAAPQLQHR
ncbi:hypothetical protein PR202_gb06608 [Eleusine coracana subsp. coracana]|uniref:Uncharacterized protein n=1 Tax=Eleusine coracana subsp. coracana TaxID=191504 RepID=A0AAV5E9Z9_ELECO|nr:hypothetical protein QOZ80_2BG0159690 [Eleusine coracana subsp. coracana]GJN19341.1 hypothetical protein PR202_gb06608 [Eleusine coracana subsp. coracana]